MSLDLGNLSIGLSVDDASFNRSIDQATQKLDGVVKAGEKASRTKIDVTPTGARNLDSATRSADGLAKGLDKAAGSASKIKAPTGVSGGLDNASASAGKLATELDRAGVEAQELGGASSGVGSMESALGSALSMAKQLVPALGAATAAGSLMTKGWDRLTSIDNAEFKLKGLGHSAQSTADIMNSAMDSVKGTAYGFGDAASLAAGTVAATGAEGERLTEILTTIADTSAISGRSLNEMGMIFNKVAASGKIQGEELNQMMDAGIPILNLLADQMGVTAEEVRDLASEGQVSFSVFEAAMREGMGGAAVEMGQSVTGALANVAAAWGRLGAEIQGTGFNVLPSLLGGVTTGIDNMTESVSTLAEWFDGIPGPVKSMTAALLAAKVGSKALGGELGDKLLGHLKNAGTGALNMGKSVTGAFKDMADAYQKSSAPLLKVAEGHRVAGQAARTGALEAKDAFTSFDYMGQQAAHGMGRHTATIAGHMKGLGGAVKSGVGSVVNALGGPLTLALTGATIAVTQIISEINKANRSTELLRELGESAEQAGESIYEAFYAGNAEAGLQAINDHVEQLIDTQAELAETSPGFFSNFVAGWNDIKYAVSGEGWNMGTKLKEEQAEVAQSAEDFTKALEEAGITAEWAGEAVGGSSQEFDQLIGSLDLSTESGRSAAAQLKEARDEVMRARSAAEGADDSFVAINGGMQELADSSGDAASQISGLRTALQEAGLIETTAVEAAAELAEKINDIKAAATEGIDEELPLGTALFGENGMLSVETNENALNLNNQLTDLRESYWLAVESGMSADEAWSQSQDTLAALAEAYQLPIEEVERLANSYGMLPEETELYLSVQGAGEVAGALAGVHADLQGVEEGATVNLGMIDDGVVNALEDLGYDLEKMDNGSWEVTVGSNAAEVNDDLAGLLRSFDLLGANEVSPEVLLDTSTLEGSAAHAGQIIESLDMSNAHPEADLIVDKLMAGKDLSVRELGVLSSYTADPDAVLNNWSFMQDIGMSNEQLSAFGVRSETADLHANDQASGKVDSLLGKLNNFPTTITTTIATKIAGAGARLLGGGYTGGRFDGARFLPGYAYGGRHGGYQLPTTGPGTDETDGFLALDQWGMPIARLDKDEWVINGESSQRWNHLLAAINANDPAMIARAAAEGVRGYAEGGQAAASSESGGKGDASGESSPLLEDSTATLTITAEGVADQLSMIGGELETLSEGETITVDAISQPALDTLTALGIETEELPDGAVEVHATTEDALDALAGTTDMLMELGDLEVNPVVLLDSTELEVSAEHARQIVDELNIQEPTPIASLIIDDLLAGKGVAQGELDFLAAMVPTPNADLNTSLLQSGVQVSESELHRVGNSKATSVVDADNSSAIANVNATLDALNSMPVERVIRIVAAGSAASALGGYAKGGKLPAYESGGRHDGYRLPTTGPGTDMVDGFVGMDSAGIPTAMVDAGEWVTNRRRSAEYDRTLEAINHGTPAMIYDAIRADLAGKIPAFARGGVVSPEQLLDFAGGQSVMGQQAARSLQGAPYVWGGVNWGDCSGAMAGLANFATGKPAFGSRFATGNQREALAAMGFAPGLGDPATSFNVGWFNGGPWGGHTSGDIAGTAVEMGGGAGGQGKIGGAAAPASSSQYTDHAHLTLGELWAFDYFRNLPLIQGGTTPAPNPRYQTEGGAGVGPGGLGLALANALGGGVSHTGGDGVHLNDGTVIPYEGGRLYDTGGRWRTGTWGFNDSGEDEYVFTGRQMGDFVRATGSLESAANEITSAFSGGERDYKNLAAILGNAEWAKAIVSGAAHLGALADPKSEAGATARGVASRVLDLDILPRSSELSGILEAEREIWEAREDSAARIEAVSQAERDLEDARRAQIAARRQDSSMTQADAEKIADAERELSTARADGDPEAVTAAEKRLADARRSGEENASKAADDYAQAQVQAADDVASAEENLAEKRREQVENLDHIGGSTLGDMFPQIGQASRQLSGHLPQVADALTNIAGVALPAGFTLGSALAMVKSIVGVVKEVAGIIAEWRESAREARQLTAEAFADSVSQMAEWSQVVESQRQAVSRLRMAVSEANLEIIAAQWDVRTAQLDVGRAQLESVRSVREAEAALQAERERQARASWWAANDLSLAYDRLRWGAEDYSGMVEQVTPEIMALQQEVLAAQLSGLSNVKSAQLQALESSYALMDAQKLMVRSQRDLTMATERYARMTGSVFGLSGTEAITAAEVARLMAENARMQGEAQQATGPLSHLDWDGDGKVFFGLVDTRPKDAYNSAIEANNRLIQEWLNSEHAPDWSSEERAEINRVLKEAAELFQRGATSAAEALIYGSPLGDAARAQSQHSVWEDIEKWERERLELEDEITDTQDRIDFEMAAQPMREMIASLDAGANSATYMAEAIRETNPLIREAIEALAAFEANAAKDIAAGRPMQNVTLVGDNFNAEEVRGLLNQLGVTVSEVRGRVDALEAPDRPTTRDVFAARKG